MAHVITDTCVKDELGVEVCPVDCIHPRRDEPEFERVPQLYISPNDASIAVPAYARAPPTQSLGLVNCRLSLPNSK